jgi:hypothetical protein
MLHNTRKNLLITAVAVPLVFLAVASTSSNSFLQTAHAQIAGGTFSAKGYTGQIIVLPPNSFAPPNPSQTVAPPVGSIIGGNWSVDVNNGQISNFKWDVNHYTLGGKVNGTFTITKLTNTTGAITPGSSPTIKLNGNSTAFKGNADVIINGKPALSNAPIVFYLLNGKIVNLTISPGAGKTYNPFPLPLFGIVTSLK